MKHVRNTDQRTLSERPHGWMDAALCGPLPGFLNLPTARQREICAGCPVREQCTDWAPPVDSGDVLRGTLIYGGLTGEEQLERRNKPDPCNNGHDRAACGLDTSGWCRECRRERNARYKAKIAAHPCELHDKGKAWCKACREAAA